MLAITLVMAVAFLALAQRERNSVTTTTDTTVARQASEASASAATAQIIANILSGGRPTGGSGSAYNLRLFVSTNYINSAGFNSAVGYVNPTNVNYFYPNGNVLQPPDFIQNVANLWYLPRAPVMISTNELAGRYYLDLNQNGVDDPNGMQAVISAITRAFLIMTLIKPIFWPPIRRRSLKAISAAGRS